MSFVISSKQHLAPTEDRIQYEPMMFEVEGVSVYRLDISFGHPLYTAAIDMYYITLDEGHSEGRYVPIVPDGCMALVFKGNKTNDEPAEGFLCGAIDEIKKIYISPEDYYVFIHRYTHCSTYCRRLCRILFPRIITHADIQRTRHRLRNCDKQEYAEAGHKVCRTRVA